MRGMPRVVTLSTWVSPRWNRPEPWAVGITPTSADTGRRSVTPRPSMRTPSSTMRLRTSFLVSERSEEHTSELQSRVDLVCRLLLEKKKKTYIPHHIQTQQ